jgi:hypothetical protein
MDRSRGWQNRLSPRHSLGPGWLERDTALSLNPTRWSAKTYTTYVTTMDRWSSRLGIPNHQLEEILFTEEAALRGLGAWGARR